MHVTGNVIDNLAVDLPATVATPILGANGLDMSGWDTLVVQIVNLNASHPIDVITVQESVGSGGFVTSTLAVNPIPASSSSVIRIKETANGRIQILLTPVSHVSADIHYHTTVVQ